MKSITMIIAVLIAILAASANAAVVYEGFDYTPTDGTLAINGLAGGTGFDGAWYSCYYDAAKGEYPAAIEPEVYNVGTLFPSLPTSGGALQRPDRTGSDATARTISSAAQAALTQDNTTMWFSVLMKVKSGGIFNFPVNSYGTLIFGDAGLEGGAAAVGTAPSILDSGNAIGVGFAGTQNQSSDLADVRIQGVTYKNGDASYITGDRIVVGNNLTLIVGKVDWAANGTDDVLSLYNVSDPSAPLPTAFTTMTADLDQSTFNILSIGDAQTALFDEVRFGATYEEVAYAPTPKNGEVVVAQNPLTLSWVNLDPYDPNDSVYVDVWFGTEPNELNPNYDMAKVVDAATTGQDATTVNVNASDPNTYYWWVDSYLNGSANINEPNKIAGALYSFTAVSDMPPSVVIDTPDQATWSDEPVPLQATVTDDGQSAVTILWTADAASLADPNLTINIADETTATPTVTIIRDAPGGVLPTVTMTVTVTDENTYDPTPATDTVDIAVYYDACRMARFVLGRSHVEGVTVDTDFNNDCVTNLADFAELAAAWLGDYSSMGPLDRQ